MNKGVKEEKANRGKEYEVWKERKDENSLK